MNDQLRLLISLQQTDLEILQLQARTDEAPHEIGKLDQDLAESNQQLELAREAHQQHVRQAKQLERELDVLQENLDKSNTQLMEVKNNQQYKAVLLEIDAAKGRISSTEDKILEQMLAAEESEKKASEVEAALENTRRGVEEKRRDLQQFMATAETTSRMLRDKRGQVLATLTPDLDALYRRIAKARNGQALAEARDQSCQVCHIRLRPQLFNEIKASQHIFTCENCNRILYYAPS